MNRRTIAAALLVGLASPVLAQRAGPAYDQAAGIASGRSADAAYDGSAARMPVQPQAAVPFASDARPAASTNVMEVSRPPLTDTYIPNPAAAPAYAPDFIKAPEPAGAENGVPASGGPIGAAVGAFAGLSIGFFLSKLLS
jgi:hypothetical protein